MKIRFVLYFFLISTAVIANSIPTQRIVAVTDSILISKVGEHLRPYFELSNEGSHYNYLSNNKKINSEHFLGKKIIKRNITEIWIMYKFNYTKIEGMKAGIWIKLDQNLQLIEEPNLNAIPNFLIKELPSNFISKQQAKELAENLIKDKRNETSDAKLEYSKKLEKYVYSVEYKTLQINNGNKVIELEIIELDAYTGKLLNRYDSYNGLIEK